LPRYQLGLYFTWVVSPLSSSIGGWLLAQLMTAGR